MSRWAKWTAVALLVALPTIGFAVTRYRAHHPSCSMKSGCPHARHR